MLGIFSGDAGCGCSCHAGDKTVVCGCRGKFPCPSSIRWGSWHTGEDLNVPEGRVITFQADGDELYALLDMFRKAGVKVNYPAERLTPVI